MKKLLVLALILAFAFLLKPAAAVQVGVSPSQVETEVNQQGWYTIQVYNDGYQSGEFVITVLGPHLEWLNLERYYVSMNPSESREVKMYFYPSLEGTYDYEVMAYSKNNEADINSAKLTLKVLPEKEMRLLSFTAERTGNDVAINLKLTSKEERSVKIPFDIIDNTGRTVKLVETARELPSGPSEIKETVSVSDFIAGDYYVRTEIPEFGVSGQAVFSIPAINKVVTKKEIVSTPFGQQVVISVVNEGNTPVDYDVQDSLPSNQYIDFVNQPANTYVEGGEVNYNWRLEGLAPGKGATVTYNISRLPLLVSSFIVILCVVVLLGMGAVKVRTPNIRKKHIKKRGEHIIILQIRGPITSGLKGVIVKDMVTPLGRVLPEFSGPKPVVRQSESGTELLWNLGDMKPRSEIYLSYRIQPLVEAQLKMPRAYLSYRTDEDTKMRVFSRQVILE